MKIILLILTPYIYIDRLKSSELSGYCLGFCNPTANPGERMTDVFQIGDHNFFLLCRCIFFGIFCVVFLKSINVQ